MMEVPDHVAVAPALERRHQVRRQMDGWVALGAARIPLPRGSRIDSLHAAVLDLSLDGMRIHSESPLQIGHAYWFRVEGTAGVASFRVRGRVAWRTPPRTGDTRHQAGIRFLPEGGERPPVGLPS